jgi:PAS domain S-box-containing protein
LHGGLVEPLAVFANTGDGAWAVDMDQRIRFWNEAAEQTLGFPAADVLGKRCWRLLAGRDIQGKPICCHRCQTLSQVRQGETLPSFDLVCRRRDGHPLLLNVSTLFVSPEPDEGRPAQEYLIHLFRVIGEAAELPNGLRIHLLGPTAVVRSDGYVVQGRLWQRAKVRGLLAILASHPGRWLTRRLLVATFWPDMPYRSACHNLNTAVYNLRRSLEPGLRKGADSSYIRYEQDHYRLDGDEAHWLDVEAFESGLHSARAEDRPEQAIRLYGSALAYYRGQFQADIEPEWSWHRSEQKRLQRLYLASLEELALLHERIHQEEEAGALYLRILRLDPCYEPACRGLMRWAMGRGDRPTAFSHYHDLLENLRGELDIPPCRETRLLYESIRSAA